MRLRESVTRTQRQALDVRETAMYFTGIARDSIPERKANHIHRAVAAYLSCVKYRLQHVSEGPSIGNVDGDHPGRVLRELGVAHYRIKKSLIPPEIFAPHW